MAQVNRKKKEVRFAKGIPTPTRELWISGNPFNLKGSAMNRSWYIELKTSTHDSSTVH